MPRQRKIVPFLLVLKDEDRGLFTVVGPLIDDTPWIDIVSRAQAQGRRVNCFTPSPSQTREQVINEVRTQLKLKYTDKSFI
jgi:hypothetical protein